jgi:hypothetical protein
MAAVLGGAAAAPRVDNDQTIGPRLTRWAWAMKLLFRQPDSVWALASKLDVRATLFMDTTTEKLRARRSRVPSTR